MRRLIAFVLFAAVSAPVLRAAENTSPSKPNILLILTDDHGWADLGIQGVDKDIQTPNLDQLARDGVLFKRGYVTAPQCTPSRAGVLSGMYQNRFGVEHNGIPMRADVVTLPERLKAAGYLSGISGKWHLDVEDNRREAGAKNTVRAELAPRHQGFDEYFTGNLHDYSASHALDGTPLADAPRKVHDPRCRVVVQTEAALSFLGRRAKKPEQPWFLYLAYMAPHVPMESAEPWFSKTPAHLPEKRRQALSLLGAIDDGVGRLRARLKEMGQDQRTLIFFIGDNGAPLGNAWDGSLNTPLRGQKGMLSDGGIRVPFVAAWPGTIPAGQSYDHPVISLDVAATAVAQAGLPHDPKLDGVNLIPFLNGQDKAAPHPTLYWRWMSQAAILEFPYKLIALGDRQRLLFDITTPDGETIERDLIKQKPEIAEGLESKLKAWSADLKPPGMPATFDRHHEGLFGEHGIIAKADAPATKPQPDGSIQGWICRNGVLAVKDGALTITADPNAAANARPFITTTDVDLPGPITAILRLRATEGGPSTVTWRTKTTAGFEPKNSVAFDWPAGNQWRGVTVDLPIEGRLIHIRITPAKSAKGLELESVELRSKNGKAQSWRFDQSAKP